MSISHLHFTILYQPLLWLVNANNANASFEKDVKNIDDVPSSKTFNEGIK